MSDNAFAAALVLASVPVGMASGMLGVFMVRALMAWWVAP